MIVWGFADAVVTGLLLIVTIRGAHELWPFIALAALTGTLGALGNPAGRSLTPELVPTNLLTGALALRSIAGQAATIAGPAIGGLLFAMEPEAVYGVGDRAARHLLADPAPDHPPRDGERAVEPRPAALESLLGGIRFIRATPIILGAITLDLFAVLFGGSVALLPLFAKSILHTGPFGLGVLRSSVAVGALIAGIRLARKPLGGRAGRTLLIVVGTFGASMVVFGLSRWFWLSALALAVSGFVDMYLDEHPLDDGRARDAERRCAGASMPSRASSSAHRTSSAPSSRGRPRPSSARCRRSWPAACSRSCWRSIWPRVFPRSRASTGWRTSHPPVAEKCCQSGEPAQRPPQSQPTDAKARTSTPPATAMPRAVPRPVEVARPGGRDHLHAEQVGVLDVVDVDRIAVRVQPTSASVPTRRHSGS